MPTALPRLCDVVPNSFTHGSSDQLTTLVRDWAEVVAFFVFACRLHFGQRGWITLDEAASLFSPMDDQFAFGELDDEGKRIFAEFALMPTAFAIIEAVQWVASTGFAAFF